MSAPHREITVKQTDYIVALQRQLHLSGPLLDLHCQRRYGRPFAGIDRAEASSLIDELQRWRAIPADLLRALGQRDLPGLEVAS